LTQAALGGGRLSESYVSLIESGRRVPTQEVLEYLANALSCSVEALQGFEPAPDAAQAEMLIRRGEWETTSGQPTAALEHLRQGVELAQHLGLPVLASRGRAASAKALEVTGRLTEAAVMWENLLVEAGGDPRNSWTAAATVGLSRCCRELGDLERAIQVGEQFWQNVERSSLNPTAGADDRVIVGATLLAAYLELGDQKRSNELAADLLALADTIDTPMATGAAYWNAALAAQAEGRIAEALRLAERAQASMAQTHDVRNKARLQTALAGLHLRMQPPAVDEAFRLLQAAEPVLKQFGSTVDLSYCRTELARAHLQTHDYHHARAIAAETIAELENSGEGRIEAARTLMVLAAANAALDNKTGAHKATKQAAKMLEQVGATRQAASSWTELAELCVDLGETTQAIEAFRKATNLLGAKKTAGTTNPSTTTPDHHGHAEVS
jgi:tetratricopeptide (TPR) repeat protein